MSSADLPADQPRAIPVEHKQRARPASLLMNNRIKPIDQQLNSRWDTGAFATGIVETGRQAWKMYQRMFRQAMHAPGPPIIAANGQV
jgi:hypothetical protein